MVALKRNPMGVRKTTMTAKQERRGGIETPLGFWATGFLSRSRNAVVALKPWLNEQANPVRNEKQERRGGIETLLRIRCRIPTFREAGTPWWH